MRACAQGAGAGVGKCLSLVMLVLVGIGGCGARRGGATPPQGAGASNESSSSRTCRDDEVPYYESGCEGPGLRRCWPANVHPTPMEFCTCDGRTTSAPLPGGGIRWRSAGACVVADGGN